MLDFDKKVQEYKYQTLNFFDLNNKIRKVAKYLKEHNIKNVVLGISGGIDSTVVLYILENVQRSYIRDLNIYAYCIGFYNVYGHVFDPTYINTLKNALQYNPNVHIKHIDCSNTLSLMVNELKIDNPSKHLLAQSSYALRYQMLFTYAQQLNAITVGTTNRDEMEYVGWFGKNSDMVVDLQIISDWHKFEVIEAARWFEIPSQIIDRVPTGDLIDGTSDEENFGCTYDELAYFHIAKDTMCPYDLEQKYGKVIELHKKNAHKYQGQTFNPIFIR